MEDRQKQKGGILTADDSTLTDRIQPQSQTLPPNEPDEGIEEEVIFTHTPPSSYSNPNSGIRTLAGWFVLTIAAACFFCLQYYELWSAYFFIMQVVPGFVLFFTSDRDRRTKNLLLYTVIIAVLAAGIVCLRLTFPDRFQTMSGRFLTNLLFAGIGAAGGSILVYGLVHERRMKRHCTAKVTATVVRLKTATHFFRKSYCPVYRFRYEGKQYEASEFKYYRRAVPQTGDSVQLLADPTDPVTIRDVRRAKREWLRHIAFGILLLLIAAALMVLFAVTGIGIFEH